MIIEIENVIQKHNMNISGVIHIGAHHAEEVPNYIKMGIRNIVLFEPLKENFEIIKKNISYFSYANIKKYQVALGNQNKTVTMNLSSNELESSSILKPKKHLELYPDIKFEFTEEVELQRLDDYNFSNCNFMNIDVQGYELEVLKGAKETLKHIDYVYCEVNQSEIYEGNAFINQIDEYLSEYKMERVETSWWYDSGWGDALYIKKENEMNVVDLQNMGMVDEGHLGGFLVNKDPATYMPHLWEYICKKFKINSVLDVGCGMGYAIEEFLKHSSEVLGIEGSQFVFYNSPFRNNIKFHDFTKGKVPLDKTFDLCWSCEFVEHVEEDYRDNFLDSFSKCKSVAITYAEPGQDGHHHVNCQPKEYWIENLKRYGLRYDEQLTNELREVTYKDAVEFNSTYMDNHFYNRGLFFVNENM